MVCNGIDNPKRCYKTHYPVRSLDLIGYFFIVVAKRQFGASGFAVNHNNH